MGMDTGRPKEIECKSGLGKKTVPFGEWETSVKSEECSDEMILKGAYSSFGCVDSVFMWGHPLETNLVFQERVFQILGTFVVQNMECGCVTMIAKEFEGVFPGSADTGAGSILDGDSVNRVRILMVQDE